MTYDFYCFNQIFRLNKTHNMKLSRLARRGQYYENFFFF